LFSFRQVISREPPWWVATLYGPFLRPEGVTARSRTLAGLDHATHALYPHDKMQLATGAPGIGYTTDTSYDLGPVVNAGRETFIAAGSARQTAAAVYARHGREVAAELVRERDATLAEVASVLSVSRWEAARLIAEPPRSSKWLDAHQGLRHGLTASLASAVAHATRNAAAMVGIVVADAVRQARRRYARRADS
jgi:hypothetical protein